MYIHIYIYMAGLYIVCVWCCPLSLLASFRIKRCMTTTLKRRRVSLPMTVYMLRA